MVKVLDKTTKTVLLKLSIKEYRDIFHRIDKDDLNVDFRELDKIEINSKIINSIAETKKLPKSKLINLSKEYVYC